MIHNMRMSDETTHVPAEVARNSNSATENNRKICVFWDYPHNQCYLNSPISSPIFMEHTQEPVTPTETPEKTTTPEAPTGHTSGISDIQAEERQPVVNLHELIIFLRDLCIILAVVLIVRTFFVAPFEISGSSMETSYHDKDFILVDKFSYADFGIWHVGDPHRGDVVVLKPHAMNGKEFYIKRVVGLPGDTLRFENGEVYVKPA